MLFDKQQIKIGVTGSIGAGKTFVTQVFSRFGFPVFNADIEADKCMRENASLKKDIQSLFGNEVYINGALQKKFLANIVFNDKKKLQELNNLVHPLVKNSFENWCETSRSKILIKEAAILFESNTHLGLDKIICVSAEKELRIKRVMKRDSIARDQVLSRMSFQISQHEKEKLSDFVIVNDGINLLLPQIIKIIDQIS